jgi:hypothetical protein
MKKAVTQAKYLTPAGEGLEYEREVENIPVTHLPMDFERTGMSSSLPLLLILCTPAPVDQDHE